MAAVVAKLGASLVALWVAWLALRLFARWAVSVADATGGRALGHESPWIVRGGLVLAVAAVAARAARHRRAEVAPVEVEHTEPESAAPLPAVQVPGPSLIYGARPGDWGTGRGWDSPGYLAWQARTEHANGTKRKPPKVPVAEPVKLAPVINIPRREDAA